MEPMGPMSAGKENRNHGLLGFYGLRMSYGFHGINLLSEWLFWQKQAYSL
jgi:hypothetical protein